MGTSTRKTKATPQPEPPANKSELMRQLANQLATVFIVALLCLWLAVTRSEVDVPVQITPWPWWYFVILSVVALPIWLLVGRKKKTRPKRRWTFFGIALGFIWLMYFILRIPFGSNFFCCLAGILLTLTVFLLFNLVLISTGWGTERKLGKVTKWVVKRRGFYEPLSILVVFAGIFLGWKMLGDAGVSDCWMIPLFWGGVVVVFAVWLVYVFTSRSGSNRN